MKNRKILAKSLKIIIDSFDKKESIITIQASLAHFLSWQQFLISNIGKCEHEKGFHQFKLQNFYVCGNCGEVRKLNV